MNIGRVYFPGLNGLRAIAALTVLYGHTFQSFFADWGVMPDFDIPIFNQGVTLFFVISGFLITYLLITEKERTESVDVSKFYIRRILRICPLYYIYIILCIIVLCLCRRGDELCNGSILYYLFMVPNIPFACGAGLILVVHLWSIGVEQQFYLFWPWLVRKSGSVLKVASILCIALIALRYGIRIGGG